MILSENRFPLFGIMRDPDKSEIAKSMSSLSRAPRFRPGNPPRPSSATARRAPRRDDRRGARRAVAEEGRGGFPGRKRGARESEDIDFAISDLSGSRMIPKSGNRFSDKIMRKQIER